MELSIIAAEGTAAGGNISLSDQVFGCEFKEPLIHQLVVAYLANARTASAHHKNRSAVSGGGRKPWRQKGTGRARAGTIRSPLWRGGGKTFAHDNRNYSQKVNRKMYRSGMRSIVSELCRQGRLVAVEALDLEQPKTALLGARLRELELDAVLILVEDGEAGDRVERAARNLPRVDVASARGVDPVSLVGHEKVLATRAALQQLEERLQ